MRRLWSEIAHTSGATIISIIASTLSVMITGRILGPDGRGQVVAAMSWVGLFATIGTLSLGQVVLHHVAGRDPVEWLPSVAGTVLAITAGVTAVGWLAFAVLYQVSGGALFGSLPFWFSAFAFVSLPFVVWTETGRYVVTAMDRLRVANWAQIGGAIAVLGFTALLVGVLAMGVWGGVAAMAVSNFTMAAILFRVVVKGTDRLAPDRALGRKLLRGSAQLHFTAIGNYLFVQGSVLVLNYYREPAETGFYQLAMQLFSMGLIVSTAISRVSFALVARKGPDGAWPEQRTLIAQSMIAVTVIAALGYVLAPLAIRIVAGEAFMPSVPLFRMVLPALYGATLATIMASQWIGRGLFREAAALTIASGVLSLGLDIILVPRYGMHGALISTLVVYGVSILGNGLMMGWVQGKWRQSLVVGT